MTTIEPRGAGTAPEPGPAKRPRQPLPKRAVICEFVGTMILVYLICAAAISNLGRFGNGAAMGGALALVVFLFGRLSESHVNPDITLSMMVLRKIPARTGGAYIAAQLAGGLVGALACLPTFSSQELTDAHYGAALPVSATNGQLFWNEAAGTAILAMVIMAVTLRPGLSDFAKSLAAGFGLGLPVMVFGMNTGGAFNFARTLGPMIVARNFAGVGLYFVAQLVGAVIGATLYWLLDRKGASVDPQPTSLYRLPGSDGGTADGGATPA